MKRILILALLAATPLLAQAGDVYKYVDDKGVIHYTDKPPPGAKKADLPQIQTYSSQPAGGNTPVPSQPTATPMPALPPEAAAIGFYSSVRMISPAPDETFHTADAVVTAAAAVDPPLQTGQGHHLVFYLDGAARPAGGSSVVLQNLDRGAHTVSASVLDNEGKVLKQSDSVSFYMLPPTVGRNKH